MPPLRYISRNLFSASDMLERSLQSANVAASIAVIATAADLSIAGAAGAAIGGMLSATSLWKDLPKADRDMAKEMAKIADETHLTEDRKKIVLANLAQVFPNVEDMVDGLRDPTMTAGLMKAKLAQKDIADSAYKTPQALADYEAVLTAVLAPFLKPTTIEEATQIRLLQAAHEQGLSDRLRDEGITERAIIGLARRVEGDTENLGQAWLELQSAMEVAVKVQAEGRVPSNHPDFIDEVLASAAELAADGEYDDAWEAIQAAEAGLEAQTLKLWESAENIARLERNAERTTEAIIARADLEASGRASVKKIRQLHVVHYTRGLKKGIHFDQRIAVELRKAILPRTSWSDERGIALNEFGRALARLGEREAGTERLHETVKAFRAALEDLTRHRLPMEWATVQTNLGNALQALGARETDTAQLEDALSAYSAALEVVTRDRVPMDWAGTQHNLSGIKMAFFDKTRDRTHLSDARDCLSGAMEVFREAGATHYLALAEWRLAEIEARADWVR